MKFSQLNNLLRITGCISVILFCLNTSYAQSNQDSHDIRIVVPEASSIAISGESGGGIQLAPTAPIEAGMALDFESAKDQSLWLNYSAVSQEGKAIYVKISEGEVPSGTNLQVNATQLSADGNGNLGQANGSVTLSTTNQQLISGIITCYTGDGSEKGRQLAYSLVTTSQYGSIQATSNQVITVCYTITD